MTTKPYKGIMQIAWEAFQWGAVYTGASRPATQENFERWWNNSRTRLPKRGDWVLPERGCPSGVPYEPGRVTEARGNLAYVQGPRGWAGWSDRKKLTILDHPPAPETGETIAEAHRLVDVINTRSNPPGQAEIVACKAGWEIATAAGSSFEFEITARTRLEVARAYLAHLIQVDERISKNGKRADRAAAAQRLAVLERLKRASLRVVP